MKTWKAWLCWKGLYLRVSKAMVHGEDEKQPQLPPFRFKIISTCAICKYWWDLPVFQIWCSLISALTQNRHFCMFRQTGDSHFSTDDSIHGFSGWFKLKSPSFLSIFNGFFSRLTPEVVSHHHFSNHTNHPDLFSFNSCAFCHQATSSKKFYGVSWNFWAWGVLDSFCEQYRARSDFCLWSNQDLFNSGKNKL